MKTNSFKMWLHEDEGITTGIKALAGAVKQGMDDAISHGEKTANDSKAALDKANAAKIEADKVQLGKDLQTYIKNLFVGFPYHGGDGGPDDLLEQYESFKSAEQLFTFFKKASEHLSKIRKDMNGALVKQKKLTQKDLQAIERKANNAIKGDLSQDLINFAKKEADFFGRLLKIDVSEFDIDDTNVKQLLSSKMKATASNRIVDAAAALNILFLYLEKEFFAQAKTIGQVAKIRKPS